MLPLFPSQIQASPTCLTSPPAAPVMVYDSVSSVMTTAEELAVAGKFHEWWSVVAATQTDGRGQYGRSWFSPRGNLYAALHLPAVYPFSEIAGSPAIGGMLAAALVRLGFDIRIKWPNDLILVGHASPVKYRKVGGILLREKNGITIAGIGLNIASAPEDSVLRADHAFPAGKLNSAIFMKHNLQTLSDVWIYLATAIQNSFVQNGQHGWLEITEQLLLLRGEQVCITDSEHGNSPLQGQLIGLDPSGGLHLQTNSGTLICISGSLHITQPMC